jgi:hypothetical protein
VGIKKQKPTNKGIKIVSGMLAASLFAMPVLLLNGAPTSAASQSATTTVNVTIDPVISITASPNIEMDITPTASGQFRTANGNVVISTNNVKGYTTYITSNTTETSLKQPAAAGVSAVIPTVSASGTTISGNGWGWSNDASQFNPVKATGTTDNSTVFSRTTSATPTGDNKTLTIGASATTSMPSGTYSNTLLLTAVTNN